MSDCHGNFTIAEAGKNRLSQGGEQRRLLLECQLQTTLIIGNRKHMGQHCKIFHDRCHQMFNVNSFHVVCLLFVVIVTNFV